MPDNMYIFSHLPQNKTTRMVVYIFINDSVTCYIEMKLFQSPEKKHRLFTIIEGRAQVSWAP